MQSVIRPDKIGDNVKSIKNADILVGITSFNLEDQIRVFDVVNIAKREVLWRRLD